MRGNLPEYELKAPKDLGNALGMLQAEPGVWRPFAGGTDLMVLFEAGKLKHRKFISLWHLDELRGFIETPSHFTMGALTTYSQIQAHPVLREEFPMLCAAARETGAVAIQNRGTIGGNIANASPAADTPPALLVYDAELELISSSGTRWVPYTTFHTGYKKTIMRPDELIRAIRLPRTTLGWTQYYRKVGTRKAQAISKVCMAAMIRTRDGIVAEIKVAYGSVSETAIRSKHVEQMLRGVEIYPASLGLALEEVFHSIKPIDDIRSTADYRLKVARNLLEEFLCGTGSQS